MENLNNLNGNILFPIQSCIQHGIQLGSASLFKDPTYFFFRGRSQGEDGKISEMTDR